LTRSVFHRSVRRNQRWRKRDFLFQFAVFEKSSRNLVGEVSLMDVVREIFHNAYLGYRIFNTHWGRGFGKEAVNACIDIGFRRLRLHRIEAAIEPANKRSIALARSVGMRYEGLSRRRLNVRDEWRDMRIFALTVEDRGIKWRRPKTAQPG
jgi:ribosomal-protein-alanine N-acetyltransferase